MNIKHLLFLTLAALFITACSDDDEAPKGAYHLKGTYTGKADIVVNEVSHGKYTGKTVKIEPVSEELASITFTLDYKDITTVTTEASVTGKDGQYTLKGEESTADNVTTKLVSGTVSGTNDFSFVFEITSGTAPAYVVTVSSDDDGKDEPRDASAITGTYTGTANMRVMTTVYDPLTGRTVEIERINADSVNITLSLEYAGEGAMNIEKVLAGAKVTAHLPNPVFVLTNKFIALQSKSHVSTESFIRFA